MSMSMKRPSKAVSPKMVLAVAVALSGTAAAGLVMTHASADDAKPAAATASGVPVIVSLVAQGDQTEQITTVGTVLALSTVQVKSLVDGQIIDAPFTEGQIVKKGDTLFHIDPRPFQAALDQAQAALARDQAQLVSAKLDLGRTTALTSQGFASGQQKDQQTAQAKALAATVQADQAAIEMAQLNLSYADIKAPIDGKTGPILIQPGNLVKANDVGALVTLSSVKTQRISFSLAQQTLVKVQPLFQKGTLTMAASVPNDPHPAVSGPVDYLGNAVDANSGTYEMRATVDNSDGHLIPGQFVSVVLKLGTLQNAMIVDSDAVNQGQNSRYVYVVDENNTAQLKPVTVVYEGPSETVVTGDLKVGEQVVTDGQLRLGPGVKVKITQVLKRAS